MTREDQVEVLANLEAGTTIVGRGATMIREGDRVRAAGAAEAPGNEKGSRAGGPETRRSAQNQPPVDAPPRPPTGSSN
jgi:hypothetical protein